LVAAVCLIAGIWVWVSLVTGEHACDYGCGREVSVAHTLAAAGAVGLIGCAVSFIRGGRRTGVWLLAFTAVAFAAWLIALASF
jgi:hypothetical protein